MTLDKAIEILNLRALAYRKTNFSDRVAAIQLSIKALIRVRNDRINPGAYRDLLLPGETKDYCKFCGLAHTGLECPDRGKEK